MKTDIYQSFVTIAECRSITAAARELHLAQPALSMQIRSLEEYYGTELLVRLPRSVELTKAGRLFYQQCKQILTLEQNTKIEIENCKHKGSGVLKFGTTRSYPDLMIRSLLRTYADRYPDIHYELYELSSAELVNLLDIGTIEFAAIRAAQQLPEFADVVVSIDEHVRALCSQECKLLPEDTNEIELTELINKPLSLSSGLFPYIDRVCRSHGFAPMVHSLNQSRHFTLQWAEYNKAIALLPMPDEFLSPPQGLRLYNIKGSPLTLKRVIITKRGRKLSPAASRMLDIIHQALPDSHPS